MSKQYNKINEELKSQIEKIKTNTAFNEIKSNNVAKFEIKINPKIRLYNNSKNLNYINEDYYKDFIRFMKSKGFIAISNVDEYKISKIDTLSKISKTSTNKIPDLEMITLIENTFPNRIISRMRDVIFHKALDKQSKLNQKK